jgi:hypothetical protein
MALMRRAVLLLLISGASPVAAVPAPTPSAPMSLAALSQLETGLWQLDVQGRTPRQMCVSDPMTLVQIEHDQPGCSRFVIANDPKSATIHYSCQRSGWGRSTLRVENPRAATIHTQGIARNAPFDYAVQAKRVGGCGGQVSAKRR